MTSPPPLLYDTYYHIYNRGVNRENIFIEERNYTHFLNLYTKYIQPVADTFAYCLLRNHFHILVRTRSEEEIPQTLKQNQNQTLRVLKTLRVLPPDRSLEVSIPSKNFSNFFNAYAKTINSTYGRTGSLFQNPFGGVPVANDHQFWGVIAYIHQNPQKHKFVQDFRQWKWSSYHTILAEYATRTRPTGVGGGGG